MSSEAGNRNTARSNGSQIVFLPGAGGRRDYWSPVAALLDLPSEKVLLGWPGFGDTPPDPRIHSLTDLVDWTFGHVHGAVDLIAQSMGCVVALLMTLRRPDLVRKLVLAGSAGGVEMSLFQPDEWRDAYLAEQPEAARWFVDDRTDLTEEIPSVRAPVLLLWGEEDRTSPPEVGLFLAKLLPNATFVSVPGAGHMLAADAPEQVASHIQRFLAR